jgi:hypothetical protein
MENDKIILPGYYWCESKESNLKQPVRVLSRGACNGYWFIGIGSEVTQERFDIYYKLLGELK